MHHTASTKSTSRTAVLPANVSNAPVLVPEIITALKRALLMHLRHDETTTLAALVKRLSRRFFLKWAGGEYALLRIYLIAVVEQTGVLLSACVTERDGMPLREFFDSARSMNRLDDGDTVEELLEFWRSEFERLSGEVQRACGGRDYGSYH